MNSVHTETTATHDKQALVDWVLYDASCPRCTALARWFRPLLRRRGLLTAPLQSLWVPAATGLLPRAALQEMRVCTAHGELYSGADAVIYLARRIWWAWPVWAAAQWPGAMRVLRAAYRWVAAHRHCRPQTCAIAERSKT
jgi:predicted DCC family thiol-disulfide oxidoreductase YuxK